MQQTSPALGTPPATPVEAARLVDALTRHAGRWEPGSVPSVSHEALEPPVFRRILAGVDGTQGGRWAAAWARDLALLAGAKVWTVAVATPPGVVDHYLDFLGSLGAPGASDLAHEHHAHAVRAASAAADQLRAAGVDAQPEVATGPPARTLVAMADDLAADLVVVGSHGRGALSRALLGSVAEGVKNHSPAHVLLAKGPPPPTRLLLPVDGSVASKRAAALGLDLARSWGVDARLLYALAPLEEGDPEPELARLETHTFGGKGKEPLVEATADMGAPADVIVEAADEVPGSLVVMGTRGLSGVRSLATGSVSNATSHRARASVLLLKDPRRTTKEAGRRAEP